MRRGQLKYITIAVEPELYKKLRKISFDSELSISKTIRIAVKSYFKIKTGYDENVEIKECDALRK